MLMNDWITMVMCCNKTFDDLMLVSACWARSSCGCRNPTVLWNLCARRGRRWRPRASMGKKFESWSTSSEPPTFPYASPCPGEFPGLSHQWMDNVLHQWNGCVPHEWMDGLPSQWCVTHQWMDVCRISGWMCAPSRDGCVPHQWMDVCPIKGWMCAPSRDGCVPHQWMGGLPSQWMDDLPH